MQGGGSPQQAQLSARWSEVTLAGWAPERDPSGRQTAGRGTQSCCPSQPTGRLTGPKACQTDTTPGRAGGREGAEEGAKDGVYRGGGWHRGQSRVSEAGMEEGGGQHSQSLSGCTRA
ncbi:uncharacterized protein AKAME5_002673700 [Lates japonicus]|uniref:Uncharacterized protein n=1 Tax=Lates japonicus TaxID=270547 RepID=A0AAD3NLU6_LATJO|nr:uncharacterized protein AKAME5_002673700 [Lates japonicus]